MTAPTTAATAQSQSHTQIARKIVTHKCSISTCAFAALLFLAGAIMHIATKNSCENCNVSCQVRDAGVGMMAFGGVGLGLIGCFWTSVFCCPIITTLAMARSSSNSSNV